MDYLQLWAELARIPVVMAAVACPPVINMVFMVTRRPRICLCATSARYNGNAMLTMPNSSRSDTHHR